MQYKMSSTNSDNSRFVYYPRRTREQSRQLGGRSTLGLTSLPPEIIAQIFKLLEPSDLTVLFRVSKSIRLAASSSYIWQPLTLSNTFNESEDYVTRYKFLEAPFRIRPLKIPNAAKYYFHELESDDVWRDISDLDESSSISKEKRFIIARNKRSSTAGSGMLKPISDESFSIYNIDVVDQAVGLIMGTVDDGSIRIWNVKDRTGRINFAKTRCPELDGTTLSDIKIDRQSQRFWISADNYLQEWDLSTLQKIAQVPFKRPISTLSFDSNFSSSSLFVATQSTLNYIDSRLPSNSSSAVSVNAYSTASMPGYPLSVLSGSFSPQTVSVSGRFPSILTYDIRRFPSIVHSAYSGAHSLSSLLALPNRRGIIAAGEYNGRGTIELYRNPFIEQSDVNSSFASNGNATPSMGPFSASSSPPPNHESRSWVNRYSASRSCILSLCQPSWTSELILAGTADGSIHCFDTTLEGKCYRQIIDTSKTEMEADNSIMITRMLPLADSSAAILTDGQVRVFECGRPEEMDSSYAEDEEERRNSVHEETMFRAMNEYARQAVRFEMFGMHNLNAIFASF
ncbi:hypothetical protein V1511DRAFT_494109 [Dipodascopsis uninucleata]